MRNTNPPMALSSLSRTLFLGAASNSSRSRVRNEVIKDRIFFSCPQWRISFKKHQKPIQCVFQTWKNHHFTLALQHLFGFPQNFMAFSPTFPLFDPPCSSQPYRPPPVPGPGDWSAAAGWGCESRCFRYPTRRSPSPVRIGVPQKARKKASWCVKCHGVAMWKPRNLWARWVFVWARWYQELKRYNVVPPSDVNVGLDSPQ